MGCCTTTNSNGKKKDPVLEERSHGKKHDKADHSDKPDKKKKKKKVKKIDLSHSSYDFLSVNSSYDGPDMIYIE